MSLPRSGSETQILNPLRCNYPPSGPVYSALLAQELGHERNYKMEDIIFKDNMMIGFKCAICKGNHDMYTCELRERCPFDREVPDDFEVVCLCSRIDCTEFCSYPIGRVTIKESSSLLKFY